MDDDKATSALVPIQFKSIMKNEFDEYDDEPAMALEQAAPLLQESPPTYRPAPSSDESNVTRALPYALGPEKSVLSWMLQDPATYVPLAVERRIREDHFYLPAHSQLFAAINKRWDENKTVELVSLIQHLLDTGTLDRIGGPAAVAEIFSYSPTDFHFAHHLEILREKRILRSLIALSNETVAGAYDDPENAADLLDTVESRLLAIREEDTPVDNMTSSKDAVQAVFQGVEDYANGKEKERGQTTGFDVLDRMTGGLMPGEMFVVAARPSMGKTAFMTTIAEHVAVDCQAKTLVFSVEMTTHQLIQRIAYSRAKFDAGRMKRGEVLTKHDLLTIQRSMLQVAAAPLIVDDTSGITISEVRAKARRVHRAGKLSLICVDYLQLMRSKSKQATNSREREIGEISAGLKGLAKELRIPIIVLAQLNRESEKRTGKSKGVPRMSDLRESGNIEQDADQIGLLHREAYFSDDEEERQEKEGVARLILAKNRNGETGDVHLTFVAPLMRFESGAPAKDEIEKTRQERFQPD